MVRSKWTTIALIAGLASLSLALASTGRGAGAREASGRDGSHQSHIHQ